MRCLVILHEYFEPDNNTPAERTLIKISEYASAGEKARAESIYLNESLEDGAVAGSVEFAPLEELDEEWRLADEKWG